MRTRPAIVPDRPPTIARFCPDGMDSAMLPMVALLLDVAFKSALSVGSDNVALLLLGPESDELVAKDPGTTLGDLLVDFAGPE